MWVVHLISALINADACTDESLCPASAFTALAAAFATQGYYVQANLLEYLNTTGLSYFATFIYLIAGFGAIVSYVLGSPPRNYLWFFIGPAVFYWLTSNPIEALGVRWMTSEAQVSDKDQAEVWRLAEAGLAGNSYIRDHSIGIQKDKPPGSPAIVAMPFLWADTLTSDVTQQFVRLTGVFDMPGGGGGNVNTAPDEERLNWNILSDLKWATLEDITDAKLRNGDARDAFVTFLASECGDVFAAQVDEAAWITATTGEGKSVPDSVLKPGSGGDPIENLQKALRAQSVPIPEGLRNLIVSGAISGSSKSFAQSASFLSTTVKDYLFKNSGIGGITCEDYLWVLIHAFRYESGHTYYQMVHNQPGAFAEKPDSVIHNLLYGWGISDDIDERRNFLIDLIFVYMVRNEMSIAPQPVDRRYASSRETTDYVNQFARTINSKTKYGEVYSWALMMPYIQGILLYVLALAYPFAALMVILPGYHKVILTWLSFLVWAKFWDVGFAVVKVLERSVWAMIGNNENALFLNSKVKEMSQWAQVQVDCAGANCQIPTIKYAPVGTSAGMNNVDVSFHLFDRALALAANMDLDLSNSYYIYIMAALYFSVPAVTGQIVLGAKAGASSLVGGFISGFSDKVSGAAQSGYTGDYAQRVQTNNASLGQAAQAKQMRQQGLAAQAYQMSNAAAALEVDSSGLNAASSQTSALMAQKGEGTGLFASQQSPIRTFMTTPNKRIGPTNPPSSPAGSSAGSGGGASGGAAGDPAGAGGAWGFKGTAGQVFDFANPMSQRNLQTGFETAKAAKNLENYDYQSAGRAANAGRTAESFGASAGRSQASMHGQRLEGAAQWGAENSSWAQKRNYGNQLAGRAAVGGVFAGSLSPGAKPAATKDSAMSGILNTYGGGSGESFGSLATTSDTAGAANFARPGGEMGNRISAWHSNLAKTSGDITTMARQGRVGVFEAGLTSVGSVPPIQAGRAVFTTAAPADPKAAQGPATPNLPPPLPPPTK